MLFLLSHFLFVLNSKEVIIVHILIMLCLECILSLFAVAVKYVIACYTYLKVYA